MKEYSTEEVQPGQANNNNKYRYASAAVPGELMVEVDIAFLLDNDTDYVCGFLGKAVDLDICKNESVLFITEEEISVKILFTGFEGTDNLDTVNKEKVSNLYHKLQMKDKIHTLRIGY